MLYKGFQGTVLVYLDKKFVYDLDDIFKQSFTFADAYTMSAFMMTYALNSTSSSIPIFIFLSTVSNTFYISIYFTEE